MYTKYHHPTYVPEICSELSSGQEMFTEGNNSVSYDTDTELLEEEEYETFTKTICLFSLMGI